MAGRARRTWAARASWASRAAPRRNGGGTSAWLLREPTPTLATPRRSMLRTASNCPCARAGVSMRGRSGVPFRSARRAALGIYAELDATAGNYRDPSNTVQVPGRLLFGAGVYAELPANFSLRRQRTKPGQFRHQRSRQLPPAWPRDLSDASLVIRKQQNKGIANMHRQSSIRIIAIALICRGCLHRVLRRQEPGRRTTTAARAMRRRAASPLMLPPPRLLPARQALPTASWS